MDFSQTTKHINNIINRSYQFKERYDLEVMMELKLDAEGIHLNEICFYKDVEDANSVPYLLYKEFKDLKYGSPFMYHNLEITHYTNDGWSEPIISKYDEVSKNNTPYVDIKQYGIDDTRYKEIKSADQSVYMTLILGDNRQLSLDEGTERFKNTLYNTEIAYISLMNDFFSLIGLDERYAYNGKTDFNMDTFKEHLNKVIIEINQSNKSKKKGTLGGLRNDKLPEQLYKSHLHIYFERDESYRKDNHAYVNAVIQGFDLNWNTVDREGLEHLGVPIYYIMQDFIHSGRGKIDTYKVKENRSETYNSIRSLVNINKEQFLLDMEAFYTNIFKEVTPIYQALVNKEYCKIDWDISDEVGDIVDVKIVDGVVYCLDVKNRVVVHIRVSSTTQELLESYKEQILHATNKLKNLGKKGL